MPHVEHLVHCANCGESYCDICHPQGCPNCGSEHIVTEPHIKWRCNDKDAHKDYLLRI